MHLHILFDPIYSACRFLLSLFAVLFENTVGVDGSACPPSVRVLSFVSESDTLHVAEISTSDVLTVSAFLGRGLG